MDALINSWFVVDGSSFISSTCTRTEYSPEGTVDEPFKPDTLEGQSGGK